jgi:1,4-alpha-glucan branching enzyme
VTLILDRREHQLEVRWDSSGIWEVLFQIEKRITYKYRIHSSNDGIVTEKQIHSLSIVKSHLILLVVWDLDYKWKDTKWMKSRQTTMV